MGRKAQGGPRSKRVAERKKAGQRLGFKENEATGAGFDFS